MDVLSDADQITLNKVLNQRAPERIRKNQREPKITRENQGEPKKTKENQLNKIEKKRKNPERTRKRSNEIYAFQNEPKQQNTLQ